MNHPANLFPILCLWTLPTSHTHTLQNTILVDLQGVFLIRTLRHIQRYCYLFAVVLELCFLSVVAVPTIVALLSTVLSWQSKYSFVFILSFVECAGYLMSHYGDYILDRRNVSDFDIHCRLRAPPLCDVRLGQGISGHDDNKTKIAFCEALVALRSIKSRPFHAGESQLFARCALITCSK
jgi:hypothetical protein